MPPSIPDYPEPDYRASTHPDWQPFIDPATGQPVTIDPIQCSAILHALKVWTVVVDHERDKGKNPASDGYLYDAVQMARQGLTVINAKSCLMARLLYDGKAPLVDAPPTVAAAPDYSLEVPREQPD